MTIKRNFYGTTSVSKCEIISFLAKELTVELYPNYPNKMAECLWKFHMTISQTLNFSNANRIKINLNEATELFRNILKSIPEIRELANEEDLDLFVIAERLVQNMVNEEYFNQ